MVVKYMYMASWIPPAISSKADTSEYWDIFISLLKCSALSGETYLKCFRSFLFPSKSSTIFV